MQPHPLGNLFAQNLGKYGQNLCKFDKIWQILGVIWIKFNKFVVNLGKSD